MDNTSTTSTADIQLGQFSVTVQPRCAILILMHMGNPEREAVFKQVIEHLVSALNNDYDVRYRPFIFMDHEAHRGTARYLSNDMPLATRHNKALKSMLEDEWQWDYLMQLGSDDLITSDGLATAAKWMKQGCKFGSFTKCALVSLCRTKMRVHHSQGNMGAGRFVHRSLIEATIKEHGHMWSPHLIKGLDGNSERLITSTTRVAVHPIGTYLPVVFDLKTSDNLHHYDDPKYHSIAEVPFDWSMID